MKSNSRLLENTLSLFVLQGLNYAIPLITLPYLVRTLNPDGFGLIAFSQAFAQYFVIVTDYGFNLSATREVARGRDDASNVAELFSAVMAVKLCLVLLSSVVMGGLVFIVPRFSRDWKVYGASSLLVIGNALLPAWLFQGLQQMRTITWVNFVAKTVSVCGIFAFVRNVDDVAIAALWLAIGPFLGGILSIVYVLIMLKMRISVPSMGTVRRVIVEGWHVFISTSAVTLYSTSNTFILGLLAGNGAVALFTAADKVVKAVQGVFGPVTQAIYPHINELSLRSRHSALTFIRRSLFWTGWISLLCSILLAVFASAIVRSFLGQLYYGSILPLRIMASLPFTVALSNMFGVQTMLTFGLKEQFSRIIVGSALFNVLIVVPLSFRFGAPGAALAVSLTEVLVTAFMALALQRNGLHIWNPRELPA